LLKVLLGAAYNSRYDDTSMLYHKLDGWISNLLVEDIAKCNLVISDRTTKLEKIESVFQFKRSIKIIAI
jgi:hypothetical protein